LALQAGTKLGPYEILSPLGAGGMGEVYRARDPRLQREVAVKVLPRDLSQDAERLRRFEQEARAASALNHPHILAVYDLGTHDGAPFLVSELLEGESLRERLSAGPVPVRKAVEIAGQMARGLAAAHEKGIVHRDLKPDNVFLTKEGRVKILDFGLAKLIHPETSQSKLAAAPTRGPSTEAGVVLGTVGYMSPEQVRGVPVDHRTDIFALGAILYEMLSGRRAFQRGSPAETMSAILRDDPADLDVSDRGIPPVLERIVRHCLEKNPEERYRSAHDLAFDFEALSGSSFARPMAEPIAPTAPRSRRVLWLWPAAVALALAVGWLLGQMRVPRTTPAPTPRLHFTQLTDVGGAESFPALSPDGATFVYEREHGGDIDLFLQRVGGTNATNLTPHCDQDDTGASFSPDGRFIAYRSECAGPGIFIMGATGESPKRVADFGFGPTWSPDGKEVLLSTQGDRYPFSRASFGELWAVRLITGEKRLVTRHDAVQPSWSPHGQRIAFWGLKGETAQRDLWTVAADGSEAEKPPVTLTDDAAVDWSPVWSPDGDFIYFLSDRGGTAALWRLPVYEASGKPLGPPGPLPAPAPAVAGFSLASDGRIALAGESSSFTLRRAATDPQRGTLAGDPSTVYATSRMIFLPAIAPDGASFAFTLTGPREDLFWIRADGTGLRQLTDDEHRQRSVDWAPDGSRLVFNSDRSGRYDVWTIQPDGTGLAIFATSPGSAAVNAAFAPDGQRIAFDDGEEHWWIATASGQADENHLDEQPTPPGGGVFFVSAWSPDGALVLGTVNDAAGNYQGLFVYSPSEKAYRRVTRERFLGFNSCTWLGGSRYAVCPAPRRLVVVDVADGATRTLVEARPSSAYGPASASRDGRFLGWHEISIESDIWLATPEEPAAGAKR
jgi:Tol biopolymer transport system component